MLTNHSYLSVWTTCWCS